MKQADRDYLNDVIDSEGFDYAFGSYSNFEEIQDEEFHRLRLAYLAAQKALEDYINTP